MAKLNQLEEKLKDRKDLVFVKKLQQQFPQSEIYLVGGAVRDFILKEKVTDLDFLIEGLGKNQLFKFLEQEGSVQDIESRAFGIFVFRPKKGKENFDIALPRRDRWTGKGYKDLKVETGLSVKEDLSRRDFTINAMAVDLKTYQLIDNFQGQKDLRKKVIRAVGRAEKRFQEDPSRILRGIRFACQLGFKIEEKTFQAMKKNASEITEKLPDDKRRVAEEIIAEEFLKSFDANTVQTIKLYDQLKILKLLLPELEATKGVKQPRRFHAEGDVFLHTLLVLRNLEEIKTTVKKIAVPELAEFGMLDEDFSIELKLGALFHDIGKPIAFTPPSKEKDRISFNEHDDIGAEMASKIINRLKLTVFPKKNRLHVDKEQVVWLVKKHMILVVAKPEEMRLSTLEKYFFNPDDRGKKLMTLSYCDISATIPPSGKPDYLLLRKFLKKIDQVKEEVKVKQKEAQLPPPLLDGREIMELLNLKSGPEVGKTKDQLRDKELAGELKNKKEAQEWLRARSKREE